MRPEEWRQGMEHEAASVDDALWARSTRRAVWRRRRREELHTVLSWRPLSRLALILLFPAGLAVLMGLGWPKLLYGALSAVLGAFLSGNAGLLLLIVWSGRYVHLGYAPWALALVGAAIGAGALPLVILSLRVLMLKGDRFGESLRLAAVLTSNVLLTFVLLWGTGWALTRLRPGTRERAA